LLLGVALTAPCLAAAPAWNTFTVNGRVVQLTDDELAQVRKSWGGKVSLQTVLPLREAQWVLDFVGIMEANPPIPCTKLELISTTQLKGKQDRVDGKVIRGGRFDELWSVTSCGRVKRYRVVNPQGTPDLQVYEVTNPKF